MTENNQTIFANRLKHLRLASGLTQTALARKINVSRSCLANYETGNRFPDSEILTIISDVFNVSVDYLISNKPTLYDEKTAVNASNLLKTISETGKLDISNISPLSKLALLEFFNFLNQQEKYSN